MEKKNVPAITFEYEMARMERIIKRLIVLAVVELLLLFGSNLAWLIYENQFTDEVTTTIRQDVTQSTEGGGDNNFVGGDYNGNATSTNE